MNFLQIAERIAEELNGSPLSFSSVDLGKDDEGAFVITDPVQRQAVRAAQQAFDWIMEFSRHWKFLNKRGKIFDLQPGVREYRKPLIESLEWDSLYLTREGSTARRPVYQEHYDNWQAREQVIVPVESHPLYLSWAPQDRWLVWPTPDQVWTLNGNYQLKKMRLEAASDEPPWAEKYHELVVWRGLMRVEARERVQEDSTTALAVSAAQQSFNSLWAAFMGEYLPKPRGAKAQ